jgi:L-seryl-tRNA(Ser) seleniumtransferase
VGGPLPLDRLWPEPAAHRRRLEAAAAALSAGIVPAEAFLGGGAAPEEPILGEALALPGDEGLLRRLRLGAPPVVGYLREGRLVLDLRTVDPEDDPELLAAVRRALDASA